MLSQDFVLTLLQASITGAGLVLAVYALIIPLSRRIFGYRAEALYEELQELKERVRETDIHVSTDELSELKTLLESIEERQAFPTYLSWGAGTTFFFYVVSTFMGVWWVLEWQKPIMDSWLPVVFGFSTFLFLLVGLVSINDIRKIMKSEFEDLKEKIEEASSKAERKEKFRLKGKYTKSQ